MESMLAAVYHGPHDLRAERAPVPEVGAGELLIKVLAASICGTDLRIYHGGHRMFPPGTVRIPGHEVVGTIAEVGAGLSGYSVGQRVFVAPNMGCGQCPQCLNGVTVACDHLAGWGGKDDAGIPVDGGQGQAVRVPLAESTLVKVPDVGDPDPALRNSLLTLSDVMATGHHAAVSAQVGPGRTVVVVGDGAVGLCGVLAASGQMPGDELDQYEFAGELSLSCELRPIRGALAMTFAMHCARNTSQRAFILPRANADDAVYALSIIRDDKGARIISSSLSLTGQTPAYEIRYTIDGAEPQSDSRPYYGTLETSRRIRAAIFSRGDLVAQLDESTAKFRVPASAPPDKRDPFRK